MADYELHADYNRNGRLEATRAEYALRGAAPGAILLANLDADGRRLPRAVSRGSRITLDRDQPVILANDDEALPVRIVVNNASAPAGSRFFLRVEGFSRIRLRVNDATGRILPLDPARPDEIPVAVPTVPGVLNLSLTMRTLPGSPIGHVTGLETRFQLDLEDESALLLRLVSANAAGAETTHDEARVTIAPFVILDNAVKAARVYMCDLPQNQPSLIEVRDALRQIDVPLVTVPSDVASGDTWLQDQFQHALVQGPMGWRQIVLHLPRLRSDSSTGIAAANLSTFVVSHFPSRDLGVFDDFWLRELEFVDASGAVQRVSFRECDRLAIAMYLPLSLARLLTDHLKRIDPQFTPQPPATGPDGTVTWSDILGWVPQLVAEFRRNARRAEAAGNSEWEATLEQMADDAQQRVMKVQSRLPFDAQRGVVTLPTSSTTIAVSASEANRLFPRLIQMHHSANYGGNIEASPPTADAALGKLVIGNALIDGERDFMDPDLLQLLFKQRKQPIVQLDSTWLDVGHVDEFVAFVPDKRGSVSFAILRASSLLALRLVREAHSRYLSGISEHHPHNLMLRPSGVLQRRTDEGTSPVTRLFRGKVWTHTHPVVTGDDIPNILEPPRIYQDVSQALNGGDPADPDSGHVNIHGLRYWPGEGPDRTYPADITVRELLYGEQDFHGNSTNEHIETRFLAPAEEHLREAFAEPRILPLPVLFDRVASTKEWEEDQTQFSTSAFSPDVVNLQPIDGHLLIPRPYGPRMRLADAAAVLAAATAGMSLPATLLRRIDARFVRARRLHTGIYWVHRQAPVARTVPGIGTVRQLYDGLETEEDVIEQFRDSFPGVDAQERRRRIITPNRRHFDSRQRLRDGWRRFVIVDDMVDIFETYIEAVAAELDVPVFWIDSWYYHVHAGGIHCGTNVLRIPERRTRLPRVWSVADLQYGPQPIEFEPEEI